MITAEEGRAAWNNVSLSFSSEEEQGNQIILVFESLTSDLCIYNGGHLSSDKCIKYRSAVFQASCFPYSSRLYVKLSLPSPGSRIIGYLA